MQDWPRRNHARISEQAVGINVIAQHRKCARKVTQELYKKKQHKKYTRNAARQAEQKKD
jgi:hypothetical protein